MTYTSKIEKILFKSNAAAAEQMHLSQLCDIMAERACDALGTKRHLGYTSGVVRDGYIPQAETKITTDDGREIVATAAIDPEDATLKLDLVVKTWTKRQRTRTEELSASFSRPLNSVEIDHESLWRMAGEIAADLGR